MSLFKQILGVAAPIVGGIFGGPVGAALGTAIGGAINQPKQPLSMIYPPPSLPGIGNSLLPTLPAIGGAVATGGRLLAAGAGAAMRGAVAWCRRNPNWCATVGGTAAVAAMIEQGQLPMPKRHRRGRGISGRDLRSYRRVHNLLAGFCAPKARIRKVC